MIGIYIVIVYHGKILSWMYVEGGWRKNPVMHECVWRAGDRKILSHKYVMSIAYFVRSKKFFKSFSFAGTCMSKLIVFKHPNSLSLSFEARVCHNSSYFNTQIFSFARHRVTSLTLMRTSCSTCLKKSIAHYFCPFDIYKYMKIM